MHDVGSSSEDGTSNCEKCVMSTPEETSKVTCRASARTLSGSPSGSTGTDVSSWLRTDSSLGVSPDGSTCCRAGECRCGRVSDGSVGPGVGHVSYPREKTLHAYPGSGSKRAGNCSESVVSDRMVNGSVKERGVPTRETCLLYTSPSPRDA